MGMKKQKQGLSPIVTTVLLVVIALVLAAIIFMWAVGLFKEQVAKSDQPIEDVCTQLNLQASISGENEISLNNQGNYPIAKISIKVSGAGTSEKEDHEINLMPGSSSVVTSGLSLSGANVEIIPILLGTSKKSGQVKEYSCINNALEAEQSA
jgi:flagellin-like protein